MRSGQKNCTFKRVKSPARGPGDAFDAIPCAAERLLAARVLDADAAVLRSRGAFVATQLLEPAREACDLVPCRVPLELVPPTVRGGIAARARHREAEKKQARCAPPTRLARSAGRRLSVCQVLRTHK
jgi:hypothetical protein